MVASLSTREVGPGGWRVQTSFDCVASLRPAWVNQPLTKCARAGHVAQVTGVPGVRVALGLTGSAV